MPNFEAKRYKDQITKMVVDVPTSLDADQRLDVALKVLEFINNRTKAGLDANKSKWGGDASKYSEGYAKKKGVPVSGPVDLTLSSEMLGKMQYFPSLSKRGELVIGFKTGTKAERKAEWNILGSYGTDPNPKKARPFLDIVTSDVKLIVDTEVGSDS